ncbi:hypothetical protein NAS2_1375 [Conexivisphaera calida]|uniref:Uncharacterized protein n=1 Tax=Conexivisphaera calida TaxID=1874277 RepID=A0A4P2VHT6_9ARCH|nr:hypothetical protein NAS2_1375 [Conexivisphaera calida]
MSALDNFYSHEKFNGKRRTGSRAGGPSSSGVRRTSSMRPAISGWSQESPEKYKYMA